MGWVQRSDKERGLIQEAACCVLHLPGGLDATDNTHIQHTPGTCQAEQDPPLDGA